MAMRASSSNRRETPHAPRRHKVLLVVTIVAALLSASSVSAAASSKSSSSTTTTSTTTTVVALSKDESRRNANGNGNGDTATVSTRTDVIKSNTPIQAEEENDRAFFVREMLGRRLQYVDSGKRLQDFTKWVKDQGGDTTIFSMHGVESNNNDSGDSSDSNSNSNKNSINADKFTGKDQQLQIQAPLTRKEKNDPFDTSDRLNLDLVELHPHTPPSQYKGKQLNTINLRPPNALQLSLRAMRLSLHFAPCMSTVGLAVMSPTFRRNIWYAWVSSCLGSAGASFTKWAQWAATRNDMFPEALCDQLATLHSDAPAHSWQFSKNSVESSLGLKQGTLAKVFDQFEERPIASGSIAQIHKAVLRGKLVAVKIRHPRVAELIDMDFRLMTRLARLMDWIPALSWLHISDSVAQFSHTMAAQAHLQVEAHHLEVLNFNFRGWPQVNFPRPFYASSAMIIETFEPGRIVTSVLDAYDNVAETLNRNDTFGILLGNMIVEEADDDGDTNGNNDGDSHHHKEVDENNVRVEGSDLIPPQMAKFLVTTGVALYLKMLLVDNLMHADLHPGNIMLDAQRHGNRFPLPGPEAVKDFDRFGITLVDAGMVAQLTDNESSAFIGLLASLGEGDGKEAAKFALQFSIENNMSDEKRSAFMDDMVELFAERCRGYGMDVDVGHVLRGILGLIRKHQVRIDANFATLVVNCLCVESLARRVCPEYRILDAGKPLLQSYRQMCYTADGTPKPNARNSKLFKALLSAMYLKKSVNDDRFFRRERRSNEKKKAIQKVLL
jgi:aarF domain-containing kinase